VRPATCRLSSNLLAEGAPLPEKAAEHPQHLGGATDCSELELLTTKLGKLLEPLDGSEKGGADLSSIPPSLYTIDAAPEVHREWAHLKRALGMVRPLGLGAGSLLCVRVRVRMRMRMRVCACTCYNHPAYGSPIMLICMHLGLHPPPTPMPAGCVGAADSRAVQPMGC